LAIRSSAGVGITPPKVLGAPNPTSSVMMSSTLGAPFGGTTRGGHQGFDCAALRWMMPPNFGGGGGSCFPSMLVVALGEPGMPGACCAMTNLGAATAARIRAAKAINLGLVFMDPSLQGGTACPMSEVYQPPVPILLFYERRRSKRNVGADDISGDQRVTEQDSFQVPGGSNEPVGWGTWRSAAIDKH